LEREKWRAPTGGRPTNTQIVKTAGKDCYSSGRTENATREKNSGQLKGGDDRKLRELMTEGEEM